MESDIGIVRITSERLFNLGSYEHEKFTVTKDVIADTEFKAFKTLSLQLADFEKDLQHFRRLVTRESDLVQYVKYDRVIASPELLAKKTKELEEVRRQIKAFRDEHKPVDRACKCYYCTHPEEDYSEEY